ncbi:MAG: hypothetical protein Q7T21_14875 [Gallionella sp.]|nr:hypothetical protein [Gallionella sp.]
MAFEIAPQLLIAQLGALPSGEMRVISGSSMDATPEDIALLKASGRVVKTPARKKVQKTDWSDLGKNITSSTTGRSEVNKGPQGPFSRQRSPRPRSRQRQTAPPPPQSDAGISAPQFPRIHLTHRQRSARPAYGSATKTKN